MDTLVGGVGYTFLRDLSIGPVLTKHLATIEWPANLIIDEDLSFGPISIVHRFNARSTPFKKVVLFGAITRGKVPGTITSYKWKGELPSEQEIQDRISEAVTGVVSLDNLLIVGEHFQIWPSETYVVEVEPEDESWGSGFSETISYKEPEIISEITALALN